MVLIVHGFPSKVLYAPGNNLCLTKRTDALQVVFLILVTTDSAVDLLRVCPATLAAWAQKATVMEYQ
jgi:hypothetical protein